jgi:hypothetical protein
MIVICEEVEIYSNRYEKYFGQLRRLFIRAAEGQHILYFPDPETVIDSHFFQQAVAPMDEEEWKELISRTFYASDKIDWTTDALSVFNKLHVRLSSKDPKTDVTCLYCVLPEEAGNWAEMPLKVLMENIRDWALLIGAIRVYNKQKITEAYERKWIALFGCGGKDEIMYAINRESHTKTRLFVFSDSDKISYDAEIGDTQKKIKNLCQLLKIPCHILKKRMIENYIPIKIFKEIAKKADPIQSKKISEWEKWSDEMKDFGDIKKHFKSRKVKSILPYALETMGITEKLNKNDLEERSGNELEQLLDCLEKYL